MWRLAREAEDKWSGLAGQVPRRSESARAKGWAALFYLPEQVAAERDPAAARWRVLDMDLLNAALDASTHRLCNCAGFECQSLGRR